MKYFKQALSGILLLSGQLFAQTPPGYVTRGKISPKVSRSNQIPSGQNLEKFIITGKVSAQYDAPLKVYLTDNMGKTKDSCVLNKGSFEFKGELAEPFQGSLILQHNASESPAGKRGVQKDMKSLWIGWGTTSIKGEEVISKAVVDSKLNDDKSKFDTMLKAVALKEARAQDTMIVNYEKDPKSANKNYDEAMRALLPERMQITTQFINERPDSYLSLLAISSYLSSNPDISMVGPLFSKLPKQLKNTPKGKEVAAIINELKNVGIGAKAPVFVQNDTQGKAVSLADFKGKYILLDFWASWCVPCRAENPDVVKAYNEYKNKNFTVLGVSLDGEKTKKAWLDAITNDQLSWTQVSDLKEWNNAAAKMYGVRAIPANFLIDPNGKIVAKNLHGAELHKKLAEILAGN